MFHGVRSEFRTARELGDQLLGLAQRAQDQTLLSLAYWALGSTFFHLGDFGAAQAHLEQSLAFYDAQRPHAPVLLYDGLEPGVFGLAYAAFVLWHLGYPDQARHKTEAALTLAQKLAHSYSVAAAQVFAARSYQLRRDRALTQKWAEAAMTLAHEHGFPVWVDQGVIQQGWAFADQGQVEEGITQLRQGLSARNAMGTGLFHSYFLALLAEAQGKAGQAEEGLATLTEALTVVNKSGERFYEAELYRLKGALLLPPGERHKANIEEAEACFHTASKIARNQGTKSLELRAVTSLARLWHQQSKIREAHRMLSDVYHWFTEGFETKDLQEAKRLLDELRESH